MWLGESSQTSAPIGGQYPTMNTFSRFDPVFSSDTRGGIFVDADNVGAQFWPIILEQANHVARLDICRAYGDFENRKDWIGCDGVVLHDTMDRQREKNNTDLHLGLDALEFALTGKGRVVFIASCDGDFAHLAWKLRKTGTDVIGMGGQQTPQVFRKACHVFHVLQAAEISICPDREQRILEALKGELAPLVGKTNGMSIADLGQVMNKKHGFINRDHGAGCWRVFLGRYAETFELLGPPDDLKHVRLRQSA